MPTGIRTRTQRWLVAALASVGGVWWAPVTMAQPARAEGMDVSRDQGGVVTYTYDGSGNRVQKSFSPDADGVRAVYSVGPHLNVVEREDGVLVMERYVLIGGERVAYISDGADDEFYALHNDYLGSPRWLTDLNGRLWRHMRYEPFGRSIDRAEPLLRHRYAGEEVSERLIHLGGVRQYNNALGRMMQPDAVVPDPANPRSLNRYSYAYDEPLAYIDPSGSQPEDQVGAPRLPPGEFMRPEAMNKADVMGFSLEEFVNAAVEWLDIHYPELETSRAKISIKNLGIDTEGYGAPHVNAILLNGYRLGKHRDMSSLVGLLAHERLHNKFGIAAPESEKHKFMHRFALAVQAHYFSDIASGGTFDKQTMAETTTGMPYCSGSLIVSIKYTGAYPKNEGYKSIEEGLLTIGGYYKFFDY